MEKNIKITEKDRKVYDCIINYTAEYGYAPSVREIGTIVGMKSPSTVHDHLIKLEQAGMIEKRENSPRTLKAV